MEKLSVLIITFNEEINIKRTIDSVLKIADEIIVLDSFSTDKTKEICQSYNDVKFIQRKWEGYSASKNHLQSLASYDFIFSLDADEEVDSTLQDEIINLKQNGYQGFYQVNRLTNYCGKWIKHSGWYPDQKIRIYNRLQAQWDGANVHEELIFTNQNVSIVNLKGHLNHYSYYSFKGHRERADKYSTLTAQKMHDQGKKASIMKPYLSAFFRFISMYFIKLGILDGYMGYKIASISAKSNIFKYKELRRLNNL